MSSTRLIKLLEFLEADPNDPFILYALATEYNAQNDKEKAYSFYLQLTENHEDYVGTYYHLGKLYEKDKEIEKAIEIYKKGMVVARTKRDMHAFSELQAAYNTAAGLDYEDD
ncbi:tetratricopeptide repeat protein [Pedobacter mucosus]|uniref:tetratricopeptide repeat protein n=1 Tax=Pedobacter mucosus TaxID=2895286 RepID=UPI001EE42982|nr:tetratricopeptide repeat protein [Pedobacter mucosus]UKT65660.1 tetratricopeptide repeat protein [Pedobacter mucosus]